MVITFVTPAGDPETAPNDVQGDGQNEFTFTSEPTGTITLNLKVSVSPSGIASTLAQYAYFGVGNIIGSSQAAWAAGNEMGKASAAGDYLVATVVFTGLPDSNAGFGRKTATIDIGNGKSISTDYEVFFPKLEANHTGEGAGTVPNWYYYWKDGVVCGIADDCVFDPNSVIGEFHEGTSTPIHLGPQAQLWNRNAGLEVYAEFASGRTYGPYVIHGCGAGAFRVAEVIAHERLHKQRHDTFGASPADDEDGDRIPGWAEEGGEGYSGMRTHPDFPFNDTFRIGASGRAAGDEEARCALRERNHLITVYPKQDWANPGCQTKDVFEYGDDNPW